MKPDANRSCLRMESGVRKHCKFERKPVQEIVYRHGPRNPCIGLGAIFQVSGGSNPSDYYIQRKRKPCIELGRNFRFTQIDEKYNE